MKIAVLSDIHGNKTALDAVIKDIENQKIDHIIILGDHITDFPQETKSVIKTIRSLTDFVIKGNREIMLYGGEDGLKYNQFITTYLTIKELSHMDNNYIKSLPDRISLSFAEISVLCIHGSPLSPFEHIYEKDISKNTDTLNKINEKILLCGHTHEQWCGKINDKFILNPGSVGINFTGRKTAQYGIIYIEDNEINIKLKDIKYDFDLFKKSCDLEIPWIRLCIRGMEDGEIYTIKFLEEAKTRYNEWPISNESWMELFKEWCRNKII